ncbi:MAG: Holliday junction branch migration protein RuvA [Lachnospiraceae bacterium]|nr:Holliday junction branch migration protein RuvA [Lachnospiraceae bacterium]
MISFLEGKLEYADLSVAVVNCGGVGYEININASDLEKLPACGTELRIYTFLSISENTGAMLYGFLTKDELDMFRLLITVNGVGPRVAKTMLGGMNPDTLRFAILSDDAKTIAKAPGIGAKTAGKIILDLKDKVNLMDAFEKKLENTKEEAVESGLSQAKEDAVLALVSLGYSRTESLQAVKKVEITDDMNADVILKASLKFLI